MLRRASRSVQCGGSGLGTKRNEGGGDADLCGGVLEMGDEIVAILFD